MMATEKERILQLLKNSWDGNMWYGTNIKQVLEGIDAPKAFNKSIPAAHNIYELVLHMYCWRRFVLEHLEGNAAFKVEINSTFDWPVEYEATAVNWQKALDLLAETQAGLVEAFSNFDETRLDENVHGRKFSWYILVHGLIEHDIYHCGQISLLKKIINAAG